MSDSLQPHGLWHTRLPCPSPTPRVYSNMSTESVMPPNHLILCCSLLLLPSIFPSIRVFSNESVLGNRWPKFWSFSFSISPSKEDSGLISFRMDWLDLLAVLVTLNSLLQHHWVLINVQHTIRWVYYPILSSQGNWNLKQLNNLPKVTQAWILTPGQCECSCFSRQELGRGGKNNLSYENLLDSNPGHERLEWEILILFGSESDSECHSVMSDSLQFHRLYPAMLFWLWNSPGKNTVVGCHSFLQGVFLTTDQTQDSPIAGRFFSIWPTREAWQNGE